jgi:hypothetical protein
MCFESKSFVKAYRRRWDFLSMVDVVGIFGGHLIQEWELAVGLWAEIRVGALGRRAAVAIAGYLCCFGFARKRWVFMGA